jgi:chromosomal replication initiation ATPase DnaA
MADKAVQIPLDLGHRTAMGRDDFLIAPSNQDAVAWIDLWPNWPAPALVIYGSAASGKTHLAEVWRARANAPFLNADDVRRHAPEELSARGHHLAIDDADSLIGVVETEKKLFHLYNMMKEEGRSLLLTLSDAPVHRAFTLPDLASRLRAAPAVSIREPDDALLGAVLVKLFNDRQLRVGTDVIAYILPRVERSFEAIRKLVDQADHQAMMEKRPINLPMIRSMLTPDAVRE